MSRFMCVFMALGIMTLALSNQSCKAVRTLTTTSTYTAANDTAKTAITIQTKTVEEYQGVKKK